MLKKTNKILTDNKYESKSNKDLWVKQSEVDQLGLHQEMVDRPIGYSDKLIRTCLVENINVQHIYEGIPPQ